MWDTLDMGGDPKTRRLGLRLYWISPVFERERHSTVWYRTLVTRDKARKDFEKETLAGKPRYIRIEEIEKE